MKKIKYIGLLFASIGFIGCDIDNTLDEIPAAVVEEVAATAGSADFSNYVSIGASFTAGFTDGALFKASQENSFPNILSKKFAMAGGGTFTQPLMNDNIGGLTIGATVIQGPRLYFNGAGPAPLPATPTTDILNNVSGGLTNFGVPGAKSFHFGVAGYGNIAGVAAGLANPYFVRMASSPTTSVMGDALAAVPTFFTLSEVGGNDVLAYALKGGDGVDQTGNIDPTTYGSTDITDPNVFASVFSVMVNALTAGGAKGVLATVPYITTFPHFTTIPYNPLDPNDATSTFGAQVPTLNAQLIGPIVGILTAFGQGDRMSLLSTTDNSPLLIKDETLTDMSAQIAGALMANNVPAPQAQLMGAIYGQARHATEDDLFPLPTSSVIGTPKTGIPASLSVYGITYPLEDEHVLIPSEQLAIKTATDAYNTTIEAVATAKGLAIVDFKAILVQASTTGVQFDGYTMTTSLVFGGLVGLDGIHLTARGYAFMANGFLAAIDATYGSNFTAATNGKAKAANYPTNYSPSLR